MLRSGGVSALASLLLEPSAPLRVALRAENPPLELRASASSVVRLLTNFARISIPSNQDLDKMTVKLVPVKERLGMVGMVNRCFGWERPLPRRQTHTKVRVIGAIGRAAM